MSVRNLACTLFALACTAPVIAQAKEDAFVCKVKALFGKMPCGKDSYEVPANQTLKFKLDPVEHNFCLDVDAIDLVANQPVAKTARVCRGSTTILWTNVTGRPFKIRIEIAAADWDQALGGDGLTGAVVIE